MPRTSPSVATGTDADQNDKPRTGDYHRWLDEQAEYLARSIEAADLGHVEALLIASAIRAGFSEVSATIKNASYVMKNGGGR